MWSSVEWYRAWRHRGKQWKAPRDTKGKGPSWIIWDHLDFVWTLLTNCYTVWWGKWWSASQERSARVATLIKTFKTREWDHPGPQHPSTMKIWKEMKEMTKNPRVMSLKKFALVISLEISKLFSFPSKWPAVWDRLQPPATWYSSSTCQFCWICWISLLSYLKFY